MNSDAASLADILIDGAIWVLRANPRMPQLSLDEWELVFARVRDEWMRRLPHELEKLIDLEETL